MNELIQSAKMLTVKKYTGWENEKKDFFLEMMLSIDNRIVLFCKNNSDYDELSLRIGNFFHDVGRTIQDDETHPNHSFNEFTSWSKDKSFSEEQIQIIKDICLKHGSKDMPQTKEGKLIQIWDKSIVFEPEIMFKFLLMCLSKQAKEEAINTFVTKMTKWHSKIVSKQEQEKYRYAVEQFLKMSKNDQI